MLTPPLFTALIEAASKAPSPDNMQAWAFRKQGDAIEVFLARERALPTDVLDMFSWIGVGAAIENVVVAAARKGLAATVEYGSAEGTEDRAAVVRFSPGGTDDPLADQVAARVTNRKPYDAFPLDPATLGRLSDTARCLEAGVHWVTAPADLARMSALDAGSMYIRLDHKPLHDELFETLRFTREEAERTRFGLDVESLETPPGGAFLLRQLRNWTVASASSRLGISRLAALGLSTVIRKAGALCLVTALRRDPAGYMEAGRAMERLWLTATSEGLAVHPFGALPQYLTKVEVEPETFTPDYARVLRGHREPFFSLFPGAAGQHPAIVLRVGRPSGPPSRRNVRLGVEQIVRR